jgi:hypothetical protein
MSDFKTAEALRTLLGLYEGVRLGRIRCRPTGEVSVMLQVTDPRSLVRLAGCAENANVAFYVWPDSQGPTEEGTDFDEGPWYELRAQANPPGTDPTTTAAEMLCGHMTTDLVRRGVLDVSEANRLHLAWGGSE